MNKIYFFIISLIIFFNCICNNTECESETDPQNCNTHNSDVEDGYKCEVAKDDNGNELNECKSVQIECGEEPAGSLIQLSFCKLLKKENGLCVPNEEQTHCIIATSCEQIKKGANDDSSICSTFNTANKDCKVQGEACILAEKSPSNQETTNSPVSESDTTDSPGSNTETTNSPGSNTETTNSPGSNTETTNSPGSDPETTNSPESNPETKDKTKNGDANTEGMQRLKISIFILILFFLH